MLLEMHVLFVFCKHHLYNIYIYTYIYIYIYIHIWAENGATPKSFICLGFSIKETIQGFPHFRTPLYIQACGLLVHVQSGDFCTHQHWRPALQAKCHYGFTVQAKCQQYWWRVAIFVSAVVNRSWNVGPVEYTHLEENHVCHCAGAWRVDLCDFTYDIYIYILLLYIILYTQTKYIYIYMYTYIHAGFCKCICICIYIYI